MEYLSSDEMAVAIGVIALMLFLAVGIFSEPISSCVAEKQRQNTIEYRKNQTK